VFKGEYNNKAVAIKTASPKSSGEGTATNLFEEINVLCHLGVNEYIVGLVGASTVGFNDGKVFAVFELCPLGSLLDYLRMTRPEVFHSNLVQDDRIIHERARKSIKQGVEMNESRFSSKNLISWSLQISKGMEYLTQKQASVHFSKRISTLFNANLSLGGTRRPSCT
jgi:serine/threonine protein kinase